MNGLLSLLGNFWDTYQPKMPHGVYGGEWVNQLHKVQITTSYLWLGGGHTYTHKHTHIRMKVISRNQEHAGLKMMCQVYLCIIGYHTSDITKACAIPNHMICMLQCIGYHISK